jgi:hypothetical protein
MKRGSFSAFSFGQAKPMAVKRKEDRKEKKGISY